MAPPVFSSPLRRFFAAIVAIVSFPAIAHATTFPLSTPTRPTTFPLSRPALAGDVVAWGSNTFGQITIPAEATNVVAIATGLNHALALRADGTVVAWGDNRFGQCNVPSSLSDVVAVAAGTIHSLALRSNGAVIAWGTNDSRIKVPIDLTDAVGIGGNGDSSVALRRDGTVVRWGNSTVPIRTDTNIVSIGHTESDFLFLRGDGSMFRACCSNRAAQGNE